MVIYIHIYTYIYIYISCVEAYAGWIAYVTCVEYASFYVFLYLFVSWCI